MENLSIYINVSFFLGALSMATIMFVVEIILDAYRRGW